MNEKYLIELLNTLRLYRMGVWNAILLAIGGSISLFFKALANKNNLFEIIFTTLGFFTIIILILILESFNKKINKMFKMLKNIEK